MRRGRASLFHIWALGALVMLPVWALALVFAVLLAVARTLVAMFHAATHPPTRPPVAPVPPRRPRGQWLASDQEIDDAAAWFDHEHVKLRPA